MELSGLQITRGCWIDLFDAPRFSGKVRRIFGPALYLNLRCDEPDLEVRFVSVVVGPTAYVQLFTRRRPERSGTWLTPRERLVDLNVLKNELALDSIRILNRPPFPSEPGYSAFMRQMGRSLVESTRRRRKKRRKKR
jgi:hypothetical protein